MPAKLTPFTMTYPDGQAVVGVRVPNNATPDAVVRALRLPCPAPAMVIMGGAAWMDTPLGGAWHMGETRLLVDEGLIPFAQEHQLVMIDGGTATGIMAMIGLARRERGYTFPLVGVAPEALVDYPGQMTNDAQAMLDGNHSHFVLTEGKAWGDESDMLAGLGIAVAGGVQPVLGVVINGGMVVKREAHARAVGNLRFPLLVLQGSGRFADELATAYHTGGSDDPVLREIVEQGDLHVFQTKSGVEPLSEWLESFFEGNLA